jgi:hypothetical protein
MAVATNGAVVNEYVRAAFALTQQPPTEVGGLVTYGLKVRIRVD